MKYACAQLGLTGVEFAKERAEEAARKAWREQFDLASARAVAALPMLAEYCLPLVKVGGNFLAMKGSSGEEELAAARGAIKKLGGEYRETRTLHLPGGDTDPVQKDFADSDSLPQKRRKNCEKSVEITKYR